ncbi:hypothetical protein [Neobacillus rhizosphaerae]|uniref:hypothetical protein n=1 Tax=Neobacillus rhizosphaerae TaxID=2880965 RepID=UPI00200F04C1|nr:hypothetical protein [Neobacillus rhizosphaerae]
MSFMVSGTKSGQMSIDGASVVPDTVRGHLSITGGQIERVVPGSIFILLFQRIKKIVLIRFGSINNGTEFLI